MGSSARAGGSRPLAWSAAAAALLLVACLVPLVLISRYNHSYADDWHYGVWAHLALEDTGSVLAALQAALEQVPKAWVEWQGTYAAIFLMAVQPGVFGEQCYALAAPLIMGALVCASLFFWHVVLVERLRMARGAWVSVACVTCFLQLMLMPSAVEGIFWYNSAVYYTFFHSLMLVLLAALVRAAAWERPRRAALAWSCVLAVLVAGGNFVTALVACEACLVLVVVLLARAPRSAVRVLPALVLLCLGTALSMAAPGNAVRQQTQFPGDGLGVWGTVSQAVVLGVRYLVEWCDGYVLIGMAALVPVVAWAASATSGARPEPRLPGLVTFVSCALFCSSFTPTLFSMGEEGPGRVQNARFELLVVLLALNVVWWCCWAADRRRGRACPQGPVVPAGGAGPRARPASAERAAAAFSASCVAVLALACCLTLAAPDEAPGEELSAVSAARSLASGEAAAYDEQAWERIETIEGALTSYVEVPYYHDVPRVLLMGDIRGDMDNYINYRLAQWYRKSAIVGVAGEG